MRRYTTLTLLALLCGTFFATAAVSAPLRGVGATVRDYTYRNDSVVVALELDLRAIKLSSTEGIVITPTIFKSAQQTQQLAPVVVRGRNNTKSYQRAVVLRNHQQLDSYTALYSDPKDMIEHYGAGLQEIAQDGVRSYTYELPYQSWMLGSEVIFSCESFGCCNTLDEGVTRPENNPRLVIEIPQIAPYRVVPQLSLVKPEKVGVKRRDVSYSSSLVFRVGSSYIDAELANNREELHTIEKMIDSVVMDPDNNITALNIVGYASPEGSVEGNKRLSERRAIALERLLKERYQIPASLYNTSFGGENWDRLVPMVEKSDMNHKAEVLDIITGEDINDSRERALKRLAGGEPYRYMLKEFFPSVRLVVVNVDYNVNAYDLDRMKEVIGVKPQNLSLDEFYRLSETYTLGSEEFMNLFAVALQVYPHDEVALNNALVSELSRDELDVASASALVARLDESTASADVLNSLGVYYMLQGDYARSGKLLKKALSLGSFDAQENLKQIDVKLANIEQIEANKAFRRKIYGE